MNKGLESLKYLKENKRKHWLDGDKSNECLDIIEKELTLLQDLLGHITDLYMKREIDEYADREPFYYDYYIVFDNTPLKVSEELYYKIKSQLGLDKQPDKCKD